MQIKLTTFTDSGADHEAVGLSWADVTDTLGHEHAGTPEDDDVLRMALAAEGAPAWAAHAIHATDELGWYLLGPEVAEPMLDSELEGFAGDFVVVGEQCFAADTSEQTAAVARMLHRLGLPAVPVWRGQSPDTVKTTLVVAPSA